MDNIGEGVREVVLPNIVLDEIDIVFQLFVIIHIPF
jgi:hypothetical protein